MSIRYSLGEIVEILGGELLGNDEAITGVASLSSAQPGKISFLTDSKYRCFAAHPHPKSVCLFCPGCRAF